MERWRGTWSGSVRLARAAASTAAFALLHAACARSASAFSLEDTA